MRLIWIVIYYGLVQYLPGNTAPFGIGNLMKRLRQLVVGGMLAETGANINVDRLANIGSGRRMRIGSNSGIGKASCIYGDVSIGRDVMIASDVLALRQNHRFDRLDVPMNQQGVSEECPLSIGDDVWIGTRVIILPGCRIIGNGSVIGAGSVVARDVPEGVVVAGNPARVIRARGRA